jgi:hypothetical protein
MYCAAWSRVSGAGASCFAIKVVKPFCNPYRCSRKPSNNVYARAETKCVNSLIVSRENAYILYPGFLLIQTFDCV